MNYLNLEVKVVRTLEFCAASNEERGVWLALLSYCAEMENGGVIEGCESWPEVAWVRMFGVSSSEVLGKKCGLWSLSEGHLTVFGYPGDAENVVKAKRESGRSGGRKPRGSQPGNHMVTAPETTWLEDGKPHGSQPGNHMVSSLANEKERKEKEGNEKKEQASIHLEWQWNDKAAATSTQPALSPASPQAQSHVRPKPEFEDVWSDVEGRENQNVPTSPPVVHREPLGCELATHHAKTTMDTLKGRINGLRPEWAKPSVWNHSEDRLLFEGTAGQFAELDEDDWGLLKRYLNAPLNGDKNHWVPRNRSMFVKTFPDVLSAAHAWGRLHGHRSSSSTSGIKIPDFMRK